MIIDGDDEHIIIDEEDFIEHYGTPRKSGRYEWGSTGNMPQNNPEFIDYIKDMRDKGLPDTTIAEGLGISTTQLRAKLSIANNAQLLDEIAQVQKLKDKGLSNVAIAEKVYGNPKQESTVRSRLAPGAADKANILMATANVLKAAIAEKKYIDVGSGNEKLMNISETKLKNAVAVLREEGYTKHYVKVPQLGTKHFTTVQVLTAPGVTYSEVFANRDKIALVTSRSEDGGRTFLGLHPPLSISPKRVGVRYKADGGDKSDGVILVRRGIDDISLGKSRYAQVRIKVGNGHYLKGMAMYADDKDLPEGVDLLFNTNKDDTGNKLDAMKPLATNEDGSLDEDNPFGATIKVGGQQVVPIRGGKQKVTSVMNIVNEEGDWANWSKNLSSQMLSKQTPSLAQHQLKLTYEEKLADFEEIMSLTNPVIQKKLLEKFAEGTDSAAVHLKAHALRGQGTHAILPVESMKPTEIYAPNYQDGETVVLIRYPHGGKFEIPELTVNNHHPEARKLLGPNARDAVGINHEVAERLSGADFDGDTVLVIPNTGDKRISTAPALDRLKGFDPKTYKLPEEAPHITNDRKQRLMGEATNLVADMTIRGATNDEIARAVAHTMVVIDAEKHHLDVKRSAQDHGISALKKKYQGGATAGASTLITRATSRIDVEKRKARPAGEGGPINVKTGALEYVPTGETRTNKDGDTVPSTVRSQKLKETDDAHTLVSEGPGTRIERVYADHSNALKELANRSRLATLDIKNPPKSSIAATTYKAEVESLTHALNLAIANSPLERQAQVIGNTIYRMKLDANPNMDSDSKGKVKAQALTEARARIGAKKPTIDISPNEWDAIQAGAISSTMLGKILNNADLDQVRRLATPRETRVVSASKLARAQAMQASGATRAEIARALGIALGTLDEALYG